MCWEIVFTLLAALVPIMWMLPMRALRLKLGTLLAADSTTLAPATLANMIFPIVAPFTPNENLTVASLTLGSTNGLVGVACAVGTQGTAVDPVTGNQVITILPGATPFRWVTSGTFAANITVYGFALVDNTSANLYGVTALATPITFTAPGQLLDADPVTMTFVAQPLN